MVGRIEIAYNGQKYFIITEMVKVNFKHKQIFIKELIRVNS